QVHRGAGRTERRRHRRDRPRHQRSQSRPAGQSVRTHEMNPLIQLQDVSKTYRTGSVDVPAVRGVSLEIAPGEFLAILGASGSGKSTLMNLLGCLDRPDRGRYLLDGIDVSTLDRDERAHLRNRKIGFVFQNFNLLSRTSALENIELTLQYSLDHLSPATQRERALRVLELV